MALTHICSQPSNREETVGLVGFRLSYVAEGGQFGCFQTYIQASIRATVSNQILAIGI